MGADDLRAAINAAMESGGTVPVGITVLCDWCDKDWTALTGSGGILFQSGAVCPDCVPRAEASIRGYGEERFIRGRCPEGTSFADWVRGMRGPDAAVQVTKVSLPGLEAGDQRPLALAARALAAAQAGDWDAVSAALQAINDEHGADGWSLAVFAWCDTLIVAQRRSQGLPDDLPEGVVVQPAWVDGDGNVTEDPSAVSPLDLWASRLLAARAALDHPMCDALLRSLPADGAECGKHVGGLLEMVALGMNALDCEVAG